MLLPKSSPPYLNTPGKCLRFVIEGYDSQDPYKLTDFLDETSKDLTTNVTG